MLSERKGKGIWQGLYQFPLIETEKVFQKKSFLYRRFRNNENIVLFNRKEIVHKLSHQHLYTQILDCKKRCIAENK